MEFRVEGLGGSFGFRALEASDVTVLWVLH